MFKRLLDLLLKSFGRSPDKRLLLQVDIQVNQGVKMEAESGIEPLSTALQAAA